MARDLGGYTPKRPSKLLGALLNMALNAVSDRLSNRVFVLQVGAGDGASGAPLLSRFRADGWSGLLIEPHPALFRALSDLHIDSERVAVLNFGIASHAGTHPLHHLTQAAATRYPRELAAKATRDPSRLQRAMAAALPAGTPDDATATDVPMLRLDTVLTELGIDNVDVVVVNAGGEERSVLESFDLGSVNPSAVLLDSDGTDVSDDAAIIATLRAAGLEVFRIANRLLGIRSAGLAVRLDDLLTYFGTAVGQEAVE